MYRALLYLLLALWSLTTMARGPLPNDSVMPAINLDEVVVTGTRTPKTLKNSPILTRLILEKDIRSVDATNIQDLLQQELPGVEFSYAMGQQVNMNMAGFAGQGVLLLVDGERLAGETLDNTDFSRLSMTGVSRIEIIRGGASALYGSNAAGGVINIITNSAPLTSSQGGKSFIMKGNLNSRYGGHGEWRTSGGLNMSGKRWANLLDVNQYSINTYTVCNERTDNCDFRQVYGHRTWNFRDKLTFTPMDGLKFIARAGYYFKERKYNPDAPDRYRDFSAGLRGEWDINEHNRLEVSYAFDQYDKSDFIKTYHLDIRDYSNVQNTLRGLYTLGLNHSTMTIGADMQRDYLLSYQFGPSQNFHQYTADVFAQYDHTLNEHWEVIGALRWDYFSDGGDSHVTSKLGARYKLGNLSLRGGYSGGFRAPTLKEKYMNFNMVDIFDIHGNAALKAETSHNLNLSAEYTWRNFYFTLGGNYNFVDNRIATSSIRYTTTSAPYIEYVNVEQLNVFSVDATARGRWQALGGVLDASLSYNYTHEEISRNAVAQYCPARPHSFNTKLSLSYPSAPFVGKEGSLSLSGRFLSAVNYTSMYMYAPFEQRQIKNPAYTLWKLQLSQHICNRLSVSMTIDNLLNYRPQIYSFNTPITTGTTFFLGANIDIF